MQNFTGNARVLTIVAPAALTSGAPYLAGSMFVVPQATVASGALAAVITRGQFALTKKAGDTPAVGTKLYWDNTNSYITTTSTSNTFVGYAVTAAMSGDATVDTYLHGCSQ